MPSLFSSQTETYLRQTRIPLRLACRSPSGWPVALSLWYHYEDGLLYCATRKGAKVIGYLNDDPRCAYEIAGDQPPYCGVRGQAQATINPERGEEILEILLKRYLGGSESSLAQGLLKFREEEVAIVLEPVNAFTWDFTERMQDSLPQAGQESQRICPDS